jgi:hypothetical protein
VENENIFDLVSIKDLPEDLQKDALKKERDTSGICVQLLELFKIQSPLNTREIMVGMYRKYNILKKRSHFQVLVSKLIKKGRLVKVAHGVYRLPTKKVF